MSGYSIISLYDMLQELGEREVVSRLSKFSCPLNPDVEYFLHRRAIEFGKQKIATTHLVYGSYKQTNVLIGYFTLAIKSIFVRSSVLSKTKQKRIAKFGSLSADKKGYTLPAPLIAQIGKNYTNGYDRLITGDELLKLACDTISEAQRLLGGNIVYLECEDKTRLLEFYNGNGFWYFDKRTLDKDERALQDGHYLIQLLRFL